MKTSLIQNIANEAPESMIMSTSKKDHISNTIFKSFLDPVTKRADTADVYVLSCKSDSGVKTNKNLCTILN